MSTLSREDLIQLDPEEEKEILALSDERLDELNRFLAGEIEETTFGCHIRIVDVDHNMWTLNKSNSGKGDPLPRTAIGIKLRHIPVFNKGTTYTVSLQTGLIHLTVDGKRYIFLSPPWPGLKSGSAPGTFE